VSVKRGPTVFVCVCAHEREGACLSSMSRASAILSSAASLAPQNLPTLSHKQHDFRENTVEHKMCFDLYNFDLKHFSLYEEFSEILS
jgi:hypothetical protein